MYEDKLREAQYCLEPIVTTVLTRQGFKQIETVTTEDEVATMPLETGELQYQHPLEVMSFDYDGDLLNFKARQVDVTVTPNHRMLVSRATSSYKEKKSNIRLPWEMVPASQVLKTSRFRAGIDEWKGEESVAKVTLGGRLVPIEDYLEFAGYYLSEGWVINTHRARIGISQRRGTAICDRMVSCFQRLPYKVCTYENTYKSKRGPIPLLQMVVCNRDLATDVEGVFGRGAFGKKVPRWILDLSPRLLKIFVDALVAGDGSIRKRGNGNYTHYFTVSKELADALQEATFKLGYSPSLSEKKSNGKSAYDIHWSDRKIDGFGFNTDKRYTDKRPNFVTKVPYKGKVWCLRVPNGIFVTRQNGKIAIHGNSISEGHITPKQVWKIGDKDHQPLGGDLRKFRDLLLEAQNDPIFSLVCHYAVSAEFIGSAGKILPLLPEFEFIYNRILTGLFINKSMVGGEGPSYSNASVASRMLMARYITLRGKLEQWALRKIFAPVAAANEFYKRSKAEIDHHVYPTPDRQEMAEDIQSVGQEGYETKVLDLPQFDWRSKSNLLDDTLVKQLLLQLHQRTALPMRVVCEALEIDYRMAEVWLKKEEGTVFDPLYQEIRKRRAEFALGVQMRGPNVPGQRPGGGGVMELGLGAESMPAGAGAPGAGAPAGTPPGGPPGTAAGPAGIPGRPAPPVPGTVAPMMGPGGGMTPPPATPGMGMGMGMAPASLKEPKPVFSSEEDEIAKKLCSLVEEKKKVEEELELESRAGLGMLEVKRLSKKLTKDTVSESLEKAKKSSARLANIAGIADKVQDSSIKKKISGFPFRSRELNMDVLKESSFLEELKKKEQEGEDA